MTLRPLAVGEKNAARLLDMTTRDFLGLVRQGVLPAPIKLQDGTERWSVANLEAILDKSAAIPDNEDFE